MSKGGWTVQLFEYRTSKLETSTQQEKTNIAWICQYLFVVYFFIRTCIQYSNAIITQNNNPVQMSQIKIRQKKTYHNVVYK